jgi:hypothetical protein
MKSVLHRGLEELGKAIGEITAFLLVAVLVGAPFQFEETPVVTPVELRWPRSM